MKVNLDEIQTAIEYKLSAIEKILGPNYKLTLIASHNGNGGLKDADLVLTMASRADIDRALNKHLPQGFNTSETVNTTTY